VAALAIAYFSIDIDCAEAGRANALNLEFEAQMINAYLVSINPQKTPELSKLGKLCLIALKTAKKKLLRVFPCFDLKSFLSESLLTEYKITSSDSSAPRKVTLF
jgi:hypothetical protein